MTPTLAQPMSVDEYFALELATEYPNEYRAGTIIPIDRSDIDTATIKGSLVARLHPSSCPAVRAVLASFRLRVPALDAYLYPDLSVTVEKPRVESYKDTDTLLNPTVVIDVLSPRPAHADPEWRAEAYRTVASIREYVRVGHERPYVAVFRRGDDGAWMIGEEASGLDASFSLRSIGLTLATADVYEHVFEDRS